MRVGSDTESLITIGGRDPRITRSGYYIRKFKLDEFPQLINVFLGDMSLVGPRPEVRHYVEMYTEEQMHVLDVRPGITDMASIKYRNENELLEQAENPEEYYVNVIMQDKLKINLEYVAKHSFLYDMKMLFLTFWSLSVMKFIRALLNWYFGRDSLPYWTVLGVDCIILMFFYFFGYFCVLGSEGVIEFFWIKSCVLTGCLVLYLIFFKIFHTYSNIIRYSSFIDLGNVAIANALASLIVIIIRICLFETSELIFPGLRVTLFAFCFSTLAMCGWRILVKTISEITNSSDKAKGVFIYGVQNGGVSLAKSLRNQNPAKFIVKGFIAPSVNDDIKYIGGIKVYNDDQALVPLMIHKNIQGLMVSPLQSEHFREQEKLINDLTEAGIRIYMIPEALEWDGKSNMASMALKKVEIEDLLPREKIEVDMGAIRELLTNKCILITGAAGSIGSEIVKQVATFKPSKMVMIDQAETPMHNIRRMMSSNYPELEAYTIVTSITNKERMEEIFSSLRPDYVLHAAAYKHVPMMEDNPCEAVQNNIYGTRVIADLSVKYGTKKFVMISTDKAVNPTNVMGCSKRICEIYCQALNEEINKADSTIRLHDGTPAITQFVTTRFGNVLGSNGSVIPIFREQIQNGGPVTVTHPEIIRFFMLIPEACKLVLEAASFGKGGEIFVFDMGKPVKIVDLAKRMIALSKAKDIEIVFTGLRDGEKLYEEVLSTAEPTKPTIHPKINIAQVRQYPYNEICAKEDLLYKTSLTFNRMETVRIMKQIVPEFKSKQSEYEVLD